MTAQRAPAGTTVTIGGEQFTTVGAVEEAEHIARGGAIELSSTFWIADTAHLSCTERGALLRILCDFLMAGKLPDTARIVQLTRLTPETWEAMASVVLGCFYDLLRHGVRMPKPRRRRARS